MVVVIGSINLDMISVVGRLPAPGETVRGSQFSIAPGGKGANQALAAARAGARVRMVGAVGRDAFAAEALALLRDGGVDLERVAATEEPTGVALILVDAAGENVIAITPGANGTVSAADAARAGLGAGDVVLLQQEIPLATVRDALDAARQAGARSILNTAPFDADALDLVREADIVVANETEFDLMADALALGGASRADRMRSFVGETGRTVIVTLGGDGVVAASPDGDHAVPALAIEPVDTVGAGDTFCGYLGAALSEGRDLETALRRAAVAGALACLKPGAQPAIPMRDAVEAALVRSAG